jgi:serine/threonine-protein kinase RsbW
MVGFARERELMQTTQTVTVPTTLAGVREAIAAFERFGRSNGVARGAGWRMQLALDEILSNVVRHAQPGEGTTLDMIFSLDEGMVGVEIVDKAGAFNPLLAPAPDTSSSLQDRQPGGLGIALVRRLMDETLYVRRDDRNHFVMRCGRHADR